MTYVMDAFQSLRDLKFDCAVAVVNPVDAVATYGNPTTAYEWASVSKLVSTWAMLVAVTEGAVSLDDEAGPSGSTLRHLLSHSAGYAFDSRSVIGAVGSKRIYSNVGIEVAAEHVAKAVGMPFAEYTRAKVLDPLGMDTCDFYGSPAHGMRGAAVDLAEFCRAVMNGLFLSPAVFEEALQPVFPDLDGVVPGYGRQSPNTWGLGFEVRGTKDPHWTGHNASPRTVGHFGWAGSFLWIDPAIHLGAVFVGAEPFSETHQEVWPELSDRIEAAYAVLD